MNRKTLETELRAAFVAILTARELAEELADQFMTSMSRSLQNGDAVEGHAHTKQKKGGPVLPTSIEDALRTSAAGVLPSALSSDEFADLQAVTDDLELLVQHASSNQLQVTGGWGNRRPVEIRV